METYEATVTPDGQVNLSAELRTAPGVKTGGKLIFRRDQDGSVQVESRSGSLADLIGIVKNVPGEGVIDDDTISRWIDEARSARWRSIEG